MDTIRRAEISVGEPWDFEAFDGPNRLVVDMLTVVSGPQEPNWAAEYLVFRVVRPFEYRAETVELLLGSPRYAGTSLKSLAEQGGPAGFARVRPGVVLNVNSSFNIQDVDYFLIGALNFVGGATYSHEN